MGSRFIALPVGQGDAFYLETRGRCVLVDGGRSRKSLPRLLEEHAEAARLDIVVCTHNDADHVEGLIGLLEARRPPVAEVWLPATWTWRLEDMVRSPVGFLRELAEDVVRFARRASSLQEVGEICLDGQRPEGPLPIRLGAGDAPSETTAWLADLLAKGSGTSRGEASDPLAAVCRDEVSLVFRPGSRAEALWLEARKAASRIVQLARAAVQAGARIRLFEFTRDVATVRGGAPGLLEPVNGCETAPPRGRVAIGAATVLFLTEANRRSLVFRSPGDGASSAPAVLFTADSDLAFGLAHAPRPHADLLATAPHHGSEENAGAYEEVRRWAGRDPLWVRSDCASRNRPGPTYAGQPRRLCTLCRGERAPQRVELRGCGGTWIVLVPPRGCTC